MHSAFVANATLRSTEQLTAASTHLLAFHWRMVDSRWRPAVRDFVAFSQACWFGAFPVDDFKLIDGDLGLDGKRVGRAPRQATSNAASTANERHPASNWLRGWSQADSERDAET